MFDIIVYFYMLCVLINKLFFDVFVLYSTFMCSKILHNLRSIMREM